ncbi:maltokinase N-terminal cap-like domain-containing protein [Actinacidiphila yeochonensis]|uniref:maltokinase N-terminal cap-like domain-containing protein n=1 Tax=Actinacidiphila yeochonensis TaxID=89050 RepID=UPI00055AEA15|nr:hypothetical protein [Actinacidiphila yeochonensis]
MSIIYKTTLKPGKLELIAPWLPAQPWYQGADGGVPAPGTELVKTGGFRLDDPEGEVGIEFMVATDISGGEPRHYLVPLTYRSAPLEGAEHALIGETEHGVLGHRYVYDGTYDPVLQAELLALLALRSDAQMQSVGDTPDPTVTPLLSGPALPAQAAVTAVEHGPDGTDLTVETPAFAPFTLHLVRVLRPEQSAPSGAAPRAQLTAEWCGGQEEERVRGLFAVLHPAAG